MHFVKVDELNVEHLRAFWTIMAYVPNGDSCVAVWHSLRLLPFTTAEGPATSLPALFVPVASLDRTGLQPLLERISEIDEHASHRLVSKFFFED